MHPEQLDFVRKVRGEYPERFCSAHVLDVGSLDINGSNRQHFQDCWYVGIDRGPGKGVDLVCRADQYDSGAIFDVVISTECLEHDSAWQDTLATMVKLLRPDGLLIITCATTGRAEHGTRRSSGNASPYTLDYYRNVLPADLDVVREAMSWHRTEINEKSHDLYFYGFKKGPL